MATGMNSGLKGTGYKQVTTQLQDPSQRNLSQMLYQALQSGGFQKGLGDLGSLAGGDQSKFQELESPALRQFGALQGNLASRFSGMGGSGSRNSSGFQNTLGEAGVDLAERLQGQRLGLHQSAIQQLLGLSESLLGRPTFQSGFVPKKKSFWQEILGGAAGGIGQGLGSLPMLAML